MNARRSLSLLVAIAALAGSGAAGWLVAQAALPTQVDDSASRDSAPVSGEGAPVVLADDTVFWIRAGVGAFDAGERAAAIAQRLRELSRDPYFRADSVRVVSGPLSADVVAGTRVIVAVTAADAAAEGMDRDALAVAHAQGVLRVLQEQGFIARARIIVVGVLFALLAAAATFLIFRFLNRVFPRLYAGVEKGRDSWIPSLRIQNLEVVGAAQIATFLLAFLKAFRLFLLVGLLYVSVPVILSFFPWTRRYADELFGYILAPFAAIWIALLQYLPDIFALGAIAVTTYYVLKLIRSIFVGIARGTITFTGFYPDWAIPTYKLVRTLVLIFAAVACWPYLPGSDTEAFQGVGIFVGLLTAIGSATAVGNVVGGVVLTYMRPFRVGDRVRIADTEGDVIEKTLLITRIRTPKNVDITIPNSMVLASHIVNYSASAKSHGLILNTTVTIGYDVPWRQVHDLLIAAAVSVPEILRDPAPFVLQKSLNDYYPAYELNAYTREPNRMAMLYTRLHEAIQDRFNEAGVEIMSPAFTALRDGNASTIPSPHAPSPAQAPAFRVMDIVRDGAGDRDGGGS